MPSYAHFVLIERWEVGEARIYGVFRESFPKRLTRAQQCSEPKRRLDAKGTKYTTITTTVGGNGN